MADEPPDGVEVVFSGWDPLVRAAPPARKGKKAGPPVFDDHVKRVFRADAPNRVWLTDITEHRTATEGKLYCASTSRRAPTCPAGAPKTSKPSHSR